MSKFSVIIPSPNISNLVPCVEAVRKCEPGAKIIVVDDGLPENGLPAVQLLEGIKPFIFSRNMNLGIRAAGDDDVVLLNDDALLNTPGGFSLLASAAEEDTGIGIIAPVTNVTGAAEQLPQQKGIREVDHIAFVCVYVPRRTIEDVGLLDERFVTYGWEDNDYCYRIKLAKLKICVHDFVFVDHGSLHSTFRGGPRSAGDIAPGREIFREKWGWAP